MRLWSWACLAIMALLFGRALPAHADGVFPSDATPVQREQAQARFARGKELFARKNFDEARAEFSASHDIVASPNTRLQIGRCFRAMGKFVAAYAEFGRTEVEAKELSVSDSRYKLAGDAAGVERKELEPILGFVSLTINNASDGTRVTVGGEEIRRAAWTEPAPATAGLTEIVVETPGHAAVKTSVMLAQGAKTSVTVDAQSGEALGERIPAQPKPEEAPPPSAPLPLRTWAYVAGGVGAAGFVTSVVSGLMAKSTYDDLQTKCGGGPCPRDKDGEIASGRTQQTVANVALVLGVMGAGAGVTLFVLSMRKNAPASAVAVVASPAWIGVRGSF